MLGIAVITSFLLQAKETPMPWVAVELTKLEEGTPITFHLKTASGAEYRVTGMTAQKCRAKTADLIVKELDNRNWVIKVVPENCVKIRGIKLKDGTVDVIRELSVEVRLSPKDALSELMPPLVSRSPKTVGTVKMLYESRDVSK